LVLGVCFGFLFGGQRALSEASTAANSEFTRAFVGITGDFDGDHRPDRIELERGNGQSAILRVRLATSVTRVQVPNDALTLAAIDLDNDQDLDVLVISRSGRVTILVNQGNGVFWPKALPAQNQFLETCRLIVAGRTPIALTRFAAATCNAQETRWSLQRPRSQLPAGSPAIVRDTSQPLFPRGPPAHA
jgi:hypothetical protein